MALNSAPKRRSQARHVHVRARFVRLGWRLEARHEDALVEDRPPQGAERKVPHVPRS